MDRAQVDIERLILGGLADGFRPHDRAALDQLPSDELTAHCEARKALYEHVRGVWERAKADGLSPATNPRWDPVAKLCDLTRDLWATAAQAQLERRPRLLRRSTTP
jgi:hypothetical protein